MHSVAKNTPLPYRPGWQKGREKSLTISFFRIYLRLMLTASNRKNIKSLPASCSVGKVPTCNVPLEARRFPMSLRASFLSQNGEEKPYSESEPYFLRETRKQERKKWSY